jgi:FemAB-related protein (PEP-CTERM system-associated)
VVELRESAAEDVPIGRAAKVRMVLGLPGSAEALWASFPSKLRSQVKKAEKNGLSFRWGRSEDQELFYRVFSRNMRDLGSPVHARAWLQAIVRAFGQRCRLGLVFLGDDPVGCGLVLVAGRRASIPWASTVREANPLGPNMLLYWKLLEQAADDGLDAFDFGRSTPGEGTYRFKEQWGAKPQRLRWQRTSADGQWRELEPGTSRARVLAATAWSRLPVGVANVVGPVLRKYISL